MNVWKIGSRWGNHRGASLLRVFRRNGIVFIANPKNLKRFEREVKKEDYFAISDGRMIVAVAKVLDEKPRPLDEMNIRYKKTDIFHFNNGTSESIEGALTDAANHTLAVRVKIVDLEKSQYKKYDIGTFEQVKNIEIRQFVIDAYEHRETSLFNIESSTCTLLMGSDEKKSILDTHTFYNIPIYQREYSWNEEIVERFIRDIFDGFKNKEPLFIGTMQLSAPKFIAYNEKEQDVIDGQQRFSTIFCLLKYIELAYHIDYSHYNITDGWLETFVNNGKENELLQQLITVSSIDELYQVDKYKKNRYIQNTIAIANVFDEELLEDNGNAINMDIKEFLKFLFNSVYFVVLETHAGLSKTIRIFNTINTTGLDLNGNDTFKVRLYEYLKDIKHEAENIFDDISQFYGLVKETNADWQKKNCSAENIVSIDEIRTIYKEYIISKFGLSNHLYMMATDTFFERLFDQLLGIQSWPDFKSKKGEIELSLSDLYDILHIEKIWNVHVRKELSYEQMITWKMFSYTRYGRISRIAYQTLLAEPNLEQAMDQAHQILSIAFRIAYCDSISYAKYIGGTMNLLYDMFKGLYNDKMGYNNVINKGLDILNSKVKYIDNAIGREIFEKKKCHRVWGNLICMLSEYIAEKKASMPVSKIETNLFKTRFDFEHIHASANIDECVGITPQLQNSIGNLMLLEYDINRSIGDLPFKEKKDRSNKKKCYRNSNYKTVEIILAHDNWEISQIKNRKEEEIQKIKAFLSEPL
jgi:uncharacterized protein with ParB-like and HNH nuclease domain